MADVITRFKLETTQFDSKLRDSAKGIRDIAHMAQIGGKGFTEFSQKAIESAQALGTVASGATTTKDKVRDLVGAYNEAAKAYNDLSQAQQQTDFGKNLAGSLQQLQGRITEAKEELYGLKEATENIGSGGGGLFGEGGLTGMMQVFGGNLLAQGVTKLTTEITGAISESIQLAREGEGVRMAFERLGQPGLLDKLKEATHGTVSEIELMKQAIQFENFKLPLEDLATYLAFAQQKAKDTGQSIDYLVNSIVTGLGRQSKQILDNLGISASELTKRMNEGADMTTAVAEIIREEMAKAGDYVETAADRAARATADATNEMEKLGQQATPIAEEVVNMWNDIRNGGITVLNTVLTPIANSIRSIRELLNGGFSFKDGIPNLADGPVNTPTTKKPTWGDVPTYTAPGGYVVVKDKNGDVVHEGHYDDDAQKQALFKSWNTKRTGGGRSGGGKKEPTIEDFQKYMTKAILGADSLKPDEAKDALSPYQMMLPEIKKNILDIKDADLGGALAKLGEKNLADELEAINTKLKQEQMAFNMATQAASSFGAALAGIDDPAAKAAGTVIQAIANVVLGFSMAAAQASSMGPYGWIAYLGAGIGALATTISTIHSLTGYAEGGEIKGNSYSGDNIPIMANAGEVVLTKAMQGSLAQQLESPRGGGGFTASHVSGEQIWIALNAYTKRSGQGEIVTWR